MDHGQAEIVPQYRIDVSYSSACLHCYHYCDIYCGKRTYLFSNSVRIAIDGFGSYHLYWVLPGLYPYHAARGRTGKAKKQDKSISRGTWRKAIWIYWWGHHPSYFRVTLGKLYGDRSSPVVLSSWVNGLVSPYS